eukprot:jgi/Botrbrau1/13429/Bobra.0082s0033.1
MSPTVRRQGNQTRNRTSGSWCLLSAPCTKRQAAVRPRAAASPSPNPNRKLLLAVALTPTLS